MERKLSLNVYLIAFILSALVFASGLLLGNYLDEMSRLKLSEEISKTHQRLASVQLLSLMEANSSSYCPLYISSLHEIDTEIENSGHKLTYLENVKLVQDNELKNNYFILEGESYLLSKKAKQLCNDTSILLINFYSNSNCDSCAAAGIEILGARDDLLDENISVKLFSFDGTIGSPIANSLKNQYNVTTYPSIVINDRVYPGMHNKEQIKSILRENR